jgi:hypothetical protein
MMQLDTTVEVSSDGEVELRFKTNLTPGLHRLLVLIDDQPPQQVEDWDPGIVIRSEGVLLPHSLHRRDYYDEFGR